MKVEMSMDQETTNLPVYRCLAAALPMDTPYCSCSLPVYRCLYSCIPL